MNNAIHQVRHTATCGTTTTHTISISEINGDAITLTIERLPSGNFLASAPTRHKVLPPNSGKGCPFTRALKSAQYNPYVGGETLSRAL